jgi:Protein of unknown function (DUF3435)
MAGRATSSLGEIDLFRFKTISTTGPVLDCPENLYNLRVLNQELKLKDEILDKFVFCQAVKQSRLICTNKIGSY